MRACLVSWCFDGETGLWPYRKLRALEATWAMMIECSQQNSSRCRCRGAFALGVEIGRPGSSQVQGRRINGGHSALQGLGLEEVGLEMVGFGYQVDYLL